MGKKADDIDADWTGAWNEWEKFHQEIKQKFEAWEAEKIKLLAENSDLRKSLREELASTQDATCEIATVKWRLEDGELRKRLADYAHEAWSRWMEYLFDKSKHVTIPTRGDEVEDGVFIPQELVTRWVRQIKTPYKDLSEKEKESDLKEADKMMDITLTFVFGDSDEGLKS